MHTRTAVAVAAGAVVGLLAGLPVPTAAAEPGPGPFITEDDPRWDCRVNGDQVCGPTNDQGVAPGLYDARAMLISAWPTVRTCRTFVIVSCTDSYVSPQLVRLTGWGK